MRKKGTLILISAPSGTGKTTIIHHLRERLSDSGIIVTTTTRAPREGEEDGVHYHFISEQEFNEKLEAGNFIEHAQYAGNWYAIEKDELDRKLSLHDIVFVTPEIQGKRQIDEQDIPHISIFVHPEDIAVLEKRIRGRADIDDDELVKRLDTAQDEMRGAHIYDHQVVNKEGRLHEVVDEILAIIGEKE